MKLTNYFYVFLFLPFQMAFAQGGSSTPANVGLSINLLGPLFGEYGLGLFTFVSPYLQVGVQGTYFSTEYITPQIQGWQTNIRVNYFFSGFRKSGFYLGATGGLESVDVRKDESSQWKYYKDTTWSIIPGYAWIADQSFIIMVGLSYGYALGENQFYPELGFILLM